MPVGYRVYKSDFSGGGVDYTTPIADVATPAWITPAIPFNADVTYAVRAHDTANGLEESNTSARVRVLTGPAGEDYTTRPAGPQNLVATPVAPGVIGLTWRYGLAGRPAPRRFEVRWAVGAGPIDYAAAAPVLVQYDPLAAVYRARAAGLAGGTSYRLGVIAAGNGAAPASAPAEASAVAPAAAGGPAAVDGLAASLI